MKVVILFLIFISIRANYWDTQYAFRIKEANLRLGTNIKLNEKEKAANKILMEIKKTEVLKGISCPKTFPASKHFFDGGKELMEKTKIFEILRRMPKGGALHVHDAGILTSDWIVQNVSYRDNLYLKVTNETGDNIWNLKFMIKPEYNWQLVRALRNTYQTPEYFDSILYSKLSMKTHHPYSDVNTVWYYFEKIYSIITPAISYRPVFQDYFYAVMNHFRNDNVQYIELRICLPEVYELDGTILKPNEVVRLLKDVSDVFVQNFPDFFGIRIIYTTHRNVKNVEEHIRLFEELQKEFPNFVLGFDLVGQEDVGASLSSNVDIFLKYPNVRKVFHAGETNWLGTNIDDNLLNAIILNTVRIGHGFALARHPILIQEIKRRYIAVELLPISNQILLLNGPDFRNHPGGSLLAQGVPCVISSDGASFWDALPSTHDFYVTFVGLASLEDDLRLLKVLSINSILYSLLPFEDQMYVLTIWKRQWENFLDYVINLPC